MVLNMHGFNAPNLNSSVNSKLDISEGEVMLNSTNQSLLMSTGKLFERANSDCLSEGEIPDTDEDSAVY